LFQSATVTAPVRVIDFAMMYFDLLETCYRDRNMMMVVLKSDPALAPLRKHPRFISLLQRVGL